LHAIYEFKTCKAPAKVDQRIINLKKKKKKERHIIEASSNKRTTSFPLFDRIIHLYKIK